MQKVIRVFIVLLLLTISAAIVLSQSQLYEKQGGTLPWQQTAATAQAQQPAAGANYVSPDAAEREKDREILRGIERNSAQLAASSLAQNYLMIFQAIIYFLTLIIIYSLLEQVKKFANAATKAAEAARISAEAAARGGAPVHTPVTSGSGCGSQKRDVNKFIMRRLHGMYHKK